MNKYAHCQSFALSSILGFSKYNEVVQICFFNDTITLVGHLFSEVFFDQIHLH